MAKRRAPGEELPKPRKKANVHGMKLRSEKMRDPTDIEENTSAALATPELADGENNTAQEQDYTGTLVAVSTNMRPPVSTSRTSIAGPFPRPPIMPPELWKEVFLDLATPDLQAVRLVCRGLILIASDILLRTFIFRPHQRSVSLFNLVAKQGDLLACIKKLRFATGTVGIRSLSANLGPKYQSEYNNLLGGYDVMSVTGKVLLAAKRQDLDAAIKEYVEWNVKWHKGESKLYQSQAALRKMLLKVPKLLDTIEICQKDCTFTHPLLLDCWTRNHDSDSDRAALEFQDLLRALSSTKLEIKDLSHDELSQSFFHMYPECLSSLAKPLQYLTNLRLHFPVKDQSAAPFAKFWNGLGHFLKSIPKLKVLRFGFDKEMSCQEPQWVTGRERGQRDAQYYYVPLWKMFGDHTWTELESLRLDGLLLCEYGLTQMLARHAQTLKKLELVDNGLWVGSYRGLLSSLKEILTLTEFRIWGFTQALHSQFDVWVLAPTTPLDEDSMLSNRLGGFLAAKRLQTTPASTRSVAVTARLDAFVMGGPFAAWPMTPPDVYRALPRHDHTCAQCSQPVHTINAKWDERAGAVNLFEPIHTRYGSINIGEEEILEFDHSPSRNEDNSGRIGERAARQVVVERMLAQVPRYGNRDTIRRTIESGESDWQWDLPSST